MALLKGNVHFKALPANDRGVLDSSTAIPFMRVSLAPTAAQQAELERLLEAQRDPSSSDYHRWLTPEEFGDRFGASPDDLERIAAWLRSEGFTVEQKARARNWIAFSGAAGQVARTFRTQLHRYEADGETHFANASAPAVPAALAEMISEIHGLNDFRMQPARVKKLPPNYTTSGGTHYLAPDDLAAIYDISALYQAGYDGSGQKVAILGQTDINLADIRSFRARFGLAAKDPQLVLYGNDPGVSSADQIESDLDLEWAGAVARNATILFVYSTNVFASAQYAIDQNLAPVISMSYGACEQGISASSRAVAQQANAEGITWLNSSGDSGAASCDYGGPAAARYGPVVSFPADIPEITAVGGTEFNETGSTGWNSSNSSTSASATGYLPEKGWNDTASGGGIWASGGGKSAVFPKPWWQTGPGVPADGARDVPDVSLTASGAHDGYLIYASGQLYSVGGTSASAPSFAGIVTILNQYVTAKGFQAKPGLGNINPNLYSLAQNTTGVIHDITVGNNIVPCVANSTGCTTGSFGYSAGVGYDMVTGVGSVDAYNMVTRWVNQPANVGTTTALTANPASIAQSASTQLTATVTPVTGSNAPTGSVNFMLGSVSLGSAALTVSGTSATASLAVKGSSLAAGANTITANYVASGTFSNSTANVTVSVTGVTVTTKTSMTVSSATVASNGTEQLTATVTATSGTAAPAGTVTFLAGSTALGTATLSASTSGSATAVLTVSASKLVSGANSLTANYGGSSSFSGSVSAAVTVTVTAPLTATTASIAANPASFDQSTSTVLTVTVTPASGSTAPTGTVAFSTGSVNLGAAALVASTGGRATASLTVKGSSLAAGNNAVAANYAGDPKFSGSAASVVISVTAPRVNTTATAAANPPSIAQSASTTITALVRPASGSALPTGTVNFTLGSVSLGSAPLTASGGMASASLRVEGGKLSAGSNTITASYVGATGFNASSGTVLVAVTAAQTATTLTLSSSPASIAQSGSTLLTATVKAAAGSAAPVGNVTFTLGMVTLGTAQVAASGSTAIATLTVKGSSLVAGNNTITAAYSGSTAFAASTSSTVVTVSSPASNVIATVTKATSSQPGFPVKVQLQEQAGGVSTLTGFTINGTNFNSAIPSFFGGTQIAAHGSMASVLDIQWSPLPTTLVFVFNGVDPSGRTWTQTVSLVTH
jgi:hypothetical protein